MSLLSLKTALFAVDDEDGFLTLARSLPDNKVILIYVSPDGWLAPAQVDPDGSVAFADTREEAFVTLTTVNEEGDIIPLYTDEGGTVLPVMADASGQLIMPPGVDKDSYYLPSQVNYNGELVPLLIDMPVIIVEVEVNAEGVATLTDDLISDDEAEVKEDKRLSGSISVDNSGSALTGRTTVSLYLSYEDLWDMGHVASLNLSSPVRDPEDSKYALASYSIPVEGRVDGLSDLLAISSSYYKSEYTESSGDSGLFAGAGVSLSYTQNIKAETKNSGTYMSHALKYGISYDKSWSRSYGSFPDSASLLNLPVSLSYDFILINESIGFLVSSLGFVRGLGVGEAASAPAFNKERANADPRFSKLTFYVYHSKDFLNDWQWNSTLTAQYTQAALIYAEAMSMGGEYSIRGLEVSRTVGDRGVIAQMELATPELYFPLDWNARGFVFTDMGYVERLRLDDDPPDTESAVSIGTGVRTTGPRGVFADLSVAWLAAGTARNRYHDANGRLETYFRAGIEF